MDKVVLEGTEYIKASVIAKQFRYTADYIGQLCRAKKVDARLVGRTWFVNPLSLVGHQQNKYQSEKIVSVPASSQSTALPVIAREIRSPLATPVSVKMARVNPHTALVSAGDNLAAGQPSKRLFVYYEPDEESLLPNLHRKREIIPKTIRIEPVDAKRLAVRGKRNEAATLVAGDMPEVALSGVLQITDYQTAPTLGGDDEKLTVKKLDEKTLINNSISVKSDTKKSVVVELHKLPITAHSKDSFKEPTVTSAKLSHSSKKNKISVTVAQANDVDATVSSDSMRTAIASFSPRSVQVIPVQEISSLVLLSPLIATLVACACVAFILLASASVTVSGADYESQVVIQVANLMELFRL